MMRMKFTIRIVLLMLFTLSFVSCQKDTVILSTESPVGREGHSSSTEGPILLGENMGAISGILMSKDTKSPLGIQTIYLGEFLALEPGDKYLVTWELESSPSTKTDENGYFVFESIPPGTYPIIIWTPFRSVVVPDSNGEVELRVLVETGVLTELGIVEADWP